MSPNNQYTPGGRSSTPKGNPQLKNRGGVSYQLSPSTTPNQLAPVVAGVYGIVLASLSFCSNIFTVLLTLGLESATLTAMRMNMNIQIPLLGDLLQNLMNMSGFSTLISIAGLLLSVALFVVAIAAFKRMAWAYKGVIVIFGIHTLFTLLSVLTVAGIFSIFFLVVDVILLLWYMADVNVKAAFKH